jgi:hypothetical protein
MKHGLVDMLQSWKGGADACLFLIPAPMSDLRKTVCD